MDARTVRGDPHRGLLAGLMATLCFIYLSMSLTLMAGPYIVSELGGSMQIAIYAFAAFGVGNGIGIPLGRILIGKIHGWKLIIWGLFFFGVTSISSATAETYPTFLISRLMEGIVSGTFYQVILQIEINFFRKKHEKVFNRLSANLFITAAVAGVCLGGWTAYVYEWRDLFYYQGLGAFLLSFFLWIQFHTLSEVDLQPLDTPVNTVSFFFYAIGILCISFVLVTGQQFDWFRSPLINTLLIIGIPCFLFCILYDTYHERPLFSFKLFRKTLFSFLIFFVFMFFAVVTLLSLWLTLYANYTPIWLSVIFGAMLFSAVCFILFERKFPRLDPRFFVGLAIVFFGFSCFYTTIFNIEIDLGRLSISRVFAGFGLTLFLPPMLQISRALHKNLEREAHLMFHTVRVLGSAIGAGFYQIVWQRREVFFHSRMGELLTNFSTLTQEYFFKAKRINPHIHNLLANAELDVLLETKAFALALDDVFYLLGYVMVLLFILLLLSFRLKPVGKLIPHETSGETYQTVAPELNGNSP